MGSFSGIIPSSGTVVGSINRSNVGYFTNGDGSVEDEHHLLPAESKEVGTEEQPGSLASTSANMPKLNEWQQFSVYLDGHDDNPAPRSALIKIGKLFIRCYDEISSIVQKMESPSKWCTSMQNWKMFFGGIIMSIVFIVAIVAIAATDKPRNTPPGKYKLILNCEIYWCLYL